MWRDAGRSSTVVTSRRVRPARSQKYQQSRFPASLPSSRKTAAGGSCTPRSHREGAMAETFSFLAKAAWLSPRAWRKASSLSAHSGRANLGLRMIRVDTLTAALYFHFNDRRHLFFSTWEL